MSSLDLFSLTWQELWQGADPGKPVGAVYTRPEIVEIILDLAGYTPTAGRLTPKTVLEPSCGDGAFLGSIIDRLLDAEQLHASPIDWHALDLDSAIRAVDISESSIECARDDIVKRLTRAGCPAGRSRQLAENWTLHADFLLHEWDRSFSLVVGNPPYVRLEDLPPRVLEYYRRSFSTATDRADLYIAFIQRGLELLAADGVLAFICANRFAKNQYGAALRTYIARHYHVRHFLNLEHTQPFLQEVSAYPAIILIDRAQDNPTYAATLDNLSEATLEAVRKEALTAAAPRLLSSFPKWYADGSPWRTTSRAEHDFLAVLEEQFPALEDSAKGTRVGIGVATGADDVFVLTARVERIEESRLIPLMMSQDVQPEAIQWSGHYLVNPFAPADDGSLADFSVFPGLGAYLEAAGDRLRNRHVAKSRPVNWFRTIDRIWPKLQAVPKLVLPDIQAGGVVGYDPGYYYPHHNLYWISSDSWNLRALQALLRSTFVLVQVRAFSVQMRGGSLRYQAQTIRRIRIPALGSLTSSSVEHLCAVASSKNQMCIDEAASEAYGLTRPT